MDQTTFVTDLNKTPLIKVITWYLLAASVLSVFARAFTKAAVIHTSTLDDYLVPISLIFAIGQAVAVTFQTTNGVGQPISGLSSSQINAILKAEYAASLLYILSLCFSKLPTLVLLGLISPRDRYRKILEVVIVLVIFWAITAELVSAFQCRPPLVWDYLHGQCLNRTAWWTYFEIMNILTDTCLVILPLGVVWGVQTSLSKKASVLAFFGGRITVIGATICKLVFWQRSRSGYDPIFNNWPIIICTQIIQYLSIMSACILYLRPFLEALTSGFINGNDLRRRGEINPFTLGSSNVALTFALKEQKISTDQGRASEAAAHYPGSAGVSDGSETLLPEISHDPSSQNSAHLRTDLA